MNPENPSAFPAAIMVRQADGQPLTGHDFGCGGMTLRDYFAAKAMAAIADTTLQEFFKRGESTDDTKKILADASYAIADAMLRRREAT